MIRTEAAAVALRVHMNKVMSGAQLEADDARSLLLEALLSAEETAADENWAGPKLNEAAYLALLDVDRYDHQAAEHRYMTTLVFLK